jgi:hypothetical protein
MSMKGLSFIDDDMYARIRGAISPLMRQVEATAKGYVPANTEVLSGWSKPISPDINIDHFQNTMLKACVVVLVTKKDKTENLKTAFK